jgi:hypothetical protein
MFTFLQCLDARVFFPKPSWHNKRNERRYYLAHEDESRRITMPWQSLAYVHISQRVGVCGLFCPFYLGILDGVMCMYCPRYHHTSTYTLWIVGAVSRD